MDIKKILTGVKHTKIEINVLEDIKKELNLMFYNYPKANTQILKKIDNIIMKLKERNQKIIDCVEALPDETRKTIIYQYYIEGKHAYNVSMNVAYSESSVKRISYKALKELEEIIKIKKLEI